MNIGIGKRMVGVLLGLCAAILNAQNLGPVFVTMPGYIQASGKWRNASGKDDLGKHSVQIECRLEIKECSEAFAKQLGEDGPAVSVEHYRVIQWNRNDLIAEDDEPICVTNRLLINFKEQSVTAMDAPKKGAKGLPLDNGGNACDWYNRTQTYRLVR